MNSFGAVSYPATPPNNDFDPGDDVGLNELFLGVVKIPILGTLRIGRHRESLNFITATADNDQVRLERGLMLDAFNGDFNFFNSVTVQRTFLDDRAYALLGSSTPDTAAWGSSTDVPVWRDGKQTGERMSCTSIRPPPTGAQKKYRFRTAASAVRR